MSNKKKNCWEVKECGREPGGANVESLGVCPASTEVRLNGVHDGQFAGRACWVVERTLCASKVQGTYEHKRKDCQNCEFYLEIRREEGLKFNYSNLLMLKLKGKHKQ